MIVVTSNNLDYNMLSSGCVVIECIVNTLRQ